MCEAAFLMLWAQSRLLNHADILFTTLCNHTSVGYMHGKLTTGVFAIEYKVTVYADRVNAILSQVTEYLERLSDVRGLSKMALRRVEHLYYKNDLVYGAMRKLVQQQQAATAQQTTQTQQEGSDEAVEAEDLDEEETEAKQVELPHRLLLHITAVCVD